MTVEQVRDEVNMQLNRLGLYAQGWRFHLIHAKRTLGMCRYKKRQICVSSNHIRLNPKDQIMNTIFHELAHAITPGDGHGKRWKQACVKLGAKPERVSSVAKVVPHKYILVCTCCGAVIQHRHRKMSAERMAVRWHRSCGPKAKGMLKIVEVENVSV